MLVAINNFRERIGDINSYFLIIFAFVLPISVAAANFFAGLIFLFFLLEAKYKYRFKSLKNNKVIYTILIFVGLHILGLLWTEDLDWGIKIIRKEAILLYIPIFMMYVKREHIYKYISSFLMAILITEIISYGIYFKLIPIISIFSSATINNPTPFMSHITYNPFLAIAIYLLMNKVLFDKKITQVTKIMTFIFIVTMTVNMFITGGRSGQVMFFVVIVILFSQYCKSIVTGILLSSFLIITIFSSAYSFSPLFKTRVNAAINEVVNLDENNWRPSVARRIMYNINSYEIFKQSPIIGVGTGDFPSVYEDMNSSSFKYKTNNPRNPHTMYGLILGQLGLLGLISLLSIFFYQVKSYSTINVDRQLNNIKLVLPVSFFVICFGESYLLGHFTTMLFVFLSAIVYKNYEKN